MTREAKKKMWGIVGGSIGLIVVFVVGVVYGSGQLTGQMSSKIDFNTERIRGVKIDVREAKKNVRELESNVNMRFNQIHQHLYRIERKVGK